MEKTAVEWMIENMPNIGGYIPLGISLEFQAKFDQAKEMEKQKAHEYAEFAIRCDRIGMKILNFEDWIKLQTFKTK
jgi:hypothetical protein